MTEQEFAPRLEYIEIKEYKYAVYKTINHMLPSTLKPDTTITVSGNFAHGTNDKKIFIALDRSGVLRIFKGYKWDGASGPTIDTPSTIRASLIHDALYQLIRMGHLDIDIHREAADYEMDKILKQDGMWWWRRKLWIRALRIGAKSAAKADADKKYGVVKTAP